MGGEYLVLILIGLLAGMLGGLLGIGGSVLMIPAMHVLFGPDQHLYQGAAMIVNFFVVAPAVIQHRRAGAILGPIVRITIPAAAVAVIVGVMLSSGPWFRGANEIYLARLFGAFMLYVAAYNVYLLTTSRRMPKVDADTAGKIPAWKVASVVGIPTGLIAGLLGIGGGTLAIPFQQIFLRIPLRCAIANSAATIMGMSLIGATFKNYTNTQMGIPLTEALKLAAFLFPTAMLGGLVGGRLTHALPRRALRLALILLMCYAGFRLIRFEPGGPSPATLPMPATNTSISLDATSPA